MTDFCEQIWTEIFDISSISHKQNPKDLCVHINQDICMRIFISHVYDSPKLKNMVGPLHPQL